MKTFFLIAFVVLIAAIVTLFRMLLFVLGSLLYVYLLPGIIAGKRNHPHTRDIYLVCALGGWLVLPWLGALWAAVRRGNHGMLCVETPLAVHAADD
jgi:hypothetical protein